MIMLTLYDLVYFGKPKLSIIEDMNKLELTVKKQTPADYKELTAEWGTSVKDTHHFLSESYIYFLKPLVRNEYLKNVDLFCIRDAKNNIAAFMGLLNKKIEMLFVRPDMRGKGFGKKLLDYAISLKGVNKVDVNEQNRQAVDFYRRYGFKPVGRDPVDAMGKPYPILHMSL